MRRSLFPLIALALLVGPHAGLADESRRTPPWIGIALAPEPGPARIAEVYDGTPAQAAGKE